MDETRKETPSSAPTAPAATQPGRRDFLATRAARLGRRVRAARRRRRARLGRPGRGGDKGEERYDWEAAPVGLPHRHRAVHRVRLVRPRVQGRERRPRRLLPHVGGALPRLPGGVARRLAERRARRVPAGADRVRADEGVLRPEALQPLQGDALRPGLPGRARPTGRRTASSSSTAKSCIGCGYCVQACPYGSRFLSPETHTAEKCTWCYHRITKGLKPACVEVCPTATRQFGDMKREDDPVRLAIAHGRVQRAAAEPAHGAAGLLPRDRQGGAVMPEITGYAFPNDIHVHWSLMIVMYPYITGFVAGSFIVTALYHLFGKNEFQPVARLSLAASFCFLLVAGLPLQLHLGHPERGLFVMVTPNFTSAMAGFGILYSFYLVVVTLEVWFVWRKEIIETARRSRGLKRAFYAALALGTYDTSPEALEIDHRAVKLLSAIGLPSACMLHGYVGFIFGGIKANPWWSTPLMPVIFLLLGGGLRHRAAHHRLPGDREARPARRPARTPSPRWRGGSGSSSSSR